MFRTLSSWLVHLEALNAERLRSPFPKERKDRFAPLLKIAESLELLPQLVPVITVTGTNGKGSCVSLLASILNAAGYRVGAFTSPHLVHYNERIQINQIPVDDSVLSKAFWEVEQARHGQLLGYFEFTFLVSLLVFKQANLDVILVEVGIGGRFDAVNLVDADLAMITSIDLDHTQLLGNDLEAIAFEKAGIMRSHKPCVWGESKLSVQAREYADALKAPLFIYGKDFRMEVVQLLESGQTTWTFINEKQCLNKLPVPKITFLPHAACVLQALYLLSSQLEVHWPAIQAGLSKAFVPGRFQIIPGKVSTVLDVAHNPASAQLLAKNLDERIKAQRILVVLAVSKTKDIQGILLPLITKVDQWYLGEFEGEQCAPATELAACLESFSIKRYTIFDDVSKAYQAALESAQPNDVIVAMGSFHTVGAVMQLIGEGY